MLALGGARLQNRVVDGDVFALGIRGVENLFAVRRAPGGGDGFKQRSGLRQVLADRVGQRARRPDEDAGVPVVVARCHKLLGAVLVGFFDKAAHVERGVVAGQIAGFDVAVSGFGARGLDAQHHHILAGGGHGNALLQRLEEARLVGNHVVGGKNAQHSPRVFALDQEGREAAGWRGVAGHRLLHDLRGGQAGQLVGDLVGQILVGDDPGFFQRCQRHEAFHGLLDHGALAVEGENLLGASAPGTGPETRAAAPGQNHGTEIDVVQH